MADDLRAARALWTLDPGVAFLNHGSFGATPLPVLAAQQAFRDRLERAPVRFLDEELEPLLDEVREALGALAGADPDDLAFVTNATTGVNTVLRSLAFGAGDEIVVTDHGYNACLNAARYAARFGARVVVARVPFPIHDSGAALDAILDAVSPRTRLALVDHVTSPTALVLPVEEIVAELSRRGIDVLVDGAHALGMLPLRLDRLAAAYYTANAHKWLCAPKGSALLHVRRDRQPEVRPLVISHGANEPRPDRSRFRLEFDWQGTDDPTAVLSIPAAIDALEHVMPGGLPALQRRNHELAVAARNVLCDALGTAPPSPPEMLGSMATVLLPGDGDEAAVADARRVELHRQLADQGFEVPVVCWPPPRLVDSGDVAGHTPVRLAIRVSAAAYNSIEEYERLAAALVRAVGTRGRDAPTPERAGHEDAGTA